MLGFYYAQARFYNPSNRRFVQEDPVKDGSNWYAYVGNRPLGWVDPWGLFTIGDILEQSGDNNKQDVILLQTRLKELGLYSDTIDGNFGPNTVTAVNTYKDRTVPGGNTEASGFRGKVGTQTWTELGLLPAYDFNQGETLSKNSINDSTNVIVLQTQLKYMGLYNGAVDGVFNDDLADAVNIFKTDKQLGNTGDFAGVVGAQTWEALGLNTGYNESYICKGSKLSERFIWPLDSYSITTQFNQNDSAHTDHRHRGVDFAANKGTPIKAIADGSVIFAGGKANDRGRGYYVYIDHGNGVLAIYQHNSINLVTTGQYVTQGQIIAEVGNTGLSFGNHLHLEMMVVNGSYNKKRIPYNSNGQAPQHVDPLDYLGH